MAGLRVFPNAVDTASLQAGIDDAKAAAANARQMVLNRDPKLDQAAALAAQVDARYDTLEELASSYAAALPASVADRAALHTQVDALRADLTVAQTTLTALQNALMVEVQARITGDNTEAAARKAADDALAVRIAALEKLGVTVGFGVANLPASLAAGATVNVVVTLSRSMGSASYSTGYGLSGGTSLLGSLTATGVVAQTATTVTVAVKNSGLTGLVNLSTASVSVVAVREA